MHVRILLVLGFGVALALALRAVGASDALGQATGTIAGRVDVRLELGAIPRRPGVRALGTDRERGRPDRTLSVVYLENAPRGAFEDPRRSPAVLDQRQETFEPYVLPILHGTTVEFPNSDPFYHNVFSLSKTRRFDLGRYPQGQTRSVTFERPGIVRVFCEIHSHMSAFILVFAHRFFDATDALGRYRIEGVPEGVYEIVVWTDGEDRLRREVRVTGGATTELDFVVE